jgi:hypothetical protein
VWKQFNAGWRIFSQKQKWNIEELSTHVLLKISETHSIVRTRMVMKIEEDFGKDRMVKSERV